MGRSPSFLSKLARRIHPPLLTTRRESDQLLRSIQKSFKDSLDREHPHPGRTSRGPLDAHVNAVVSNPLLRAQINPTNVLQESLLAPQDHFEHEVATGNATLETAKICLSSYAKFRLSSDTLGSADGSARLLKAVEQWLWSSGLLNSMEFIHDEEFVNTFLEFMVPKARMLYAARWYHTLSFITSRRAKTNEELQREFVRPMASLFRRLVFEGHRKGHPNRLQSLLENFIQKSNKIDPKLPRSIRLATISPTLFQIINILLRSSTPIHVNDALYDHFVKVVNHDGWVGGHIRAILALKHPSNASPAEALLFFDRLSKETLHTFKQGKKDTILSLAGETTNFLLASGNIEEAQNLLDRLQTPSYKESTKETETRMSSLPLDHDASFA